MILRFIIIWTILAGGAYAKNWKKHYALVNSDIKSVEALKKRDLGLEVRLFELYGEKLSLLIEKERDYRIKFLETASNKQLDGIVKLQNRTLTKLDKLGTSIEKRTNDKKVITKINYFRALNYLSIKDDKKFFYYMRKAEATNVDKKIGYQIDIKLANYYYNENKYDEASKYYKKLLYDVKSPWLTKHYYNLAWSELKLDHFSEALGYLKKAHLFERQKGYYNIGEQLTDALLLFHAYAQKTNAGLQYFNKYNLDSFENLLKYMHYVFGHGKRQDSILVINTINQKKLTLDQEYKFLEKKILVFRTMKKFSMLQKSLSEFKKKVIGQSSKVDKIVKEELILAIKGYTGYLQELIKSERLISEKNKKSYIKYMAYNFNVLRAIDPENELEYYFYQGETYFSQEEYGVAAKIYATGIQHLKKSKKKTDPYLEKTFDSLFKSLENKKKTNKKLLLFSFSSYLYFYPKGKKSNEIYQRILSIYKKDGDEKKMFSLLRDYNKSFPNMLEIQKNFYKQILNGYIDKKDIESLRKLKEIVAGKFLGFTKKEVDAIGKVIKEIRFSKYENLAKEGKYKEAIEGFKRLYNDKKSGYAFRVDALRKVMFYQNKSYEFIDLGKTVVVSNKFLKKESKKSYRDEILFYVQNICYGDYQDSCLKTLQEIRRDFPLTGPLENFYFKLSILNSDNLANDFKVAKTESNKNFIFKLSLLEEKDFSSPLYEKFYENSKMEPVITGEIERKVLNTFYNTLSIAKTTNYVNSISIPKIKSIYLDQMKALEASIKKIEIHLPKAPQVKEMTEAIFVKFGQDIEQRVSFIFDKTQKIIQSSNPNYLPFVLSKIILKYEDEVENFKKFIPVSKNADFEAAMNDALVNFHRILDGKGIEYRQLYYRSLNNTIKGSGVKKYGEDIMTLPIQNSYGHINLWRK